MFSKKPSSPAGHQVVSRAAEARAVSKVPSIVSADMVIRGDLVGGGDLHIEGQVIGRIEAGHLVIAQGGAVEGDIVAKAVGISGTFNGNLRAGSVTLSATAKVAGDVLYDKLVIEAGAQLEGECRRIAAQGDKLLSVAPEEHGDNVSKMVA